MKSLQLTFCILFVFILGCNKYETADTPDFRSVYVGSFKAKVSGYVRWYSNTTYFDSTAYFDFYYEKDELGICYPDSILKPLIRMKYHNGVLARLQISKLGDLYSCNDHCTESYHGKFVSRDSIYIIAGKYGGGHYSEQAIIEGKRY